MNDIKAHSFPPAYYRSKLNQEEQYAYRIVVNSLLHYQSIVELQIPGFTRASIMKTVRAVHLDHPELVYVDFWKYSFRIEPFSGKATLFFYLLIESEVSDKVMSTMKSQACAEKEKLKGITVATEKYCELIRAVSGAAKYEDTGSAFWDHTAAGPLLLHTAVCEGFSKLLLYYCQQACLPCAIITGSLRGVPHAWNMIEVDGIRVYVDMTSILSQQKVSSLATENPDPLFLTEEALLHAGYTWEKV